MMERAASGALSSEALHDAAELLRLLVGGQIRATFEARPHSGKANAKAVFDASILKSVMQRVGAAELASSERTSIEMCLRAPPPMDQYADKVRKLYEQGLSSHKIG